MANFLLEIGTEELPADFSRLVLGQLEKTVSHDLKENRLDYGSIICTSTPRRLAVLIEDLAEEASDLEEVRKGPPADKAFKNGSPTEAAIGFAKRLDIDVKHLEIKETPKGQFVFGKKIEQGERASNLLIDLVPKWISGLQGTRFMRWGTKERRFSRPIRWIVSLLDEKILPCLIDDTDPEIRSGSISRGHRLYSQSIVISSASTYLSTLENSGVIVDREKRLSIISRLVKESESEMNASADIPNQLLNELTDLVEFPSIIKCDIDKLFLELPPEVLVTVMKVHQRYIPLYHKNVEIDPLSLDSRSNIFPNFLCICNSLGSAKSTVKAGNERVLRARLSDAKFFLNVDLSTPSKDRSEILNRVTFAHGLGSLYDRVNRITWITKYLVFHLNFNSQIASFAVKAAELSKNDLVSQMVGEFPELQGIMGGKYLLSEGEEYKIALAVFEQYLPKYSGDKLPISDAGSALAIAERFELILSIFSKGERPSGSSDPYALRRAGNGILQILWSKEWSLNIYKLLNESINYWSEILPALVKDQLSLKEEISEFFRLRIISLLEDCQINPDLIQAVAGSKIPIKKLLKDPNDVKLRVELLSSMRTSGKLLDLQKVFNRASKLAEKTDLDVSIINPVDIIDKSLFESQCEFELLDVINQIAPVASSDDFSRYEDLSNHLVNASKVLESFFDGDQSVMVMVDNLDVRRNRLNLLAILKNQALELADFSQLNV